MQPCKHIRDLNLDKDQLKKIKKMVCKRKEDGIYCKCITCGKQDSLCIPPGCNDIFCKEHVVKPCKSCKVHTVVFSFDSGKFTCAKCVKLKGRISERTSNKKNTLFQDQINCPIKKFSYSVETNSLVVILQIMLNCTDVRDHFFSFHHSSITCKISECPDCFFKQIYIQIYSSDTGDLSETLYFIYKRARLYPNFFVKDPRCLFSLLCGVYHRAGASDFTCNCPFHKIFYGEMRDTEECTKCLDTKAKMQEFLFLRLVCNCNLNEDFQLYFESHLSSNAIRCRRCGALTQRRRQFRVVNLPRVLCISVERAFVNRYKERGSARKLQIPKALVLEGRNYRISAFIEERGRDSSAYIIGYVNLNNTWYEFNRKKILCDANIDPKLSHASILFYTIEDEPNGSG